MEFFDMVFSDSIQYQGRREIVYDTGTYEPVYGFVQDGKFQQISGGYWNTRHFVEFKPLFRNKVSKSILKYCIKCGQLHSIDEFTINRRTFDRLAPYCKSCQRKYYRDRRDKLRGDSRTDS